MYDDFLTQLANNPELREQLASLGIYGEKQGLLGQQMGVGHELLGTPQPEGRTVGQTYVASSPLEHLAAAFRQGVGAYKMNQAQKGQQDLIRENQAARERLARAFAQQRAAQSQAPVAEQPDGYTPMNPNVT